MGNSDHHPDHLIVIEILQSRKTKLESEASIKIEAQSR